MISEVSRATGIELKLEGEPEHPSVDSKILVYQLVTPNADGLMVFVRDYQRDPKLKERGIGVSIRGNPAKGQQILDAFEAYFTQI